MLVVGTFRWLRKSPVATASHLLPQFQQNRFDSIVSAPISENRASAYINNTSPLAHTAKVDFRHKTDGRGLFRIRFTASHRDGINAVLESCLRAHAATS
jgi:hypothetical protein